MAIIYSYPTVTPESEDLIIGTDITGKVTKNFTVGSIIDLVENPENVNGTVNTIPVFTTDRAIGDSIITQDSGANGVSVGGAVEYNRKFKVHGHSSIDGNLYISGASSTYSIEVGQSRSTEGVALLDLTGEVQPDDYGLRMIRYGGENAESAIIHTGTSNLRIRAENSADTVFENTKVGIGTTTPSSKLDVNGTVSISNTGTSSTLNLKSSSTAPGGNYIHAKKSDNSNQWVLGSNSASTDSVVLKQYNDADIIFQNNNGDAMTINSNSYVGIGTTNPQAMLDVNGVIAMKGTEQLLWDNNNGTLDIAPSVGQVKILTGVITIDYNRNVGINTTSPSEKLHVVGSALIEGSSTELKVKGSGNYDTANIVMGNASKSDSFSIDTRNDPSGNYTTLSFDSYQTTGTSTITLGDNYVNLGTAGSSRVTINSSGNVGIGTTNPQSTLDVDGILKVRGQIDLLAGSNPVLSIFSSGGTSPFINSPSGKINFGAPSSNTTDVYVQGNSSAKELESTESAKGLILKSPDGTRYRVTVANGGTLSVSAV